MVDPVRTPYSRLWTIEDRASPVNAPLLQGAGRALGLDWGLGDLTPIREPDPNRYGAFRVVGFIQGERDLPSLPVQIRYGYTLSEMLRIARKGCPLDLQVHVGACENPNDFNLGWQKVLVVEGAQITNYGTDDLGALNQGDDAVVNENIDTSGLDAYEIGRLTMSEIAGTQVTREMVDVAICDAVSCGSCGLSSDGCQKFFALSVAAGGSPGLPADVIYSQNGGQTVGETNITSLPIASSPSALACVGSNLAVVSSADCSIHYASITAILAGAAAWTRVATGLVCAAGAPNDIFSRGSALTWIVGQGGNIYFSSDITGGVTVQDAGVATSQPLQAIHGFDDLNLVAVGDSNAVVYTRNGGASWASVTGPAVGVPLTTVWMRGKDEWWVGSGTAGGRLYYTRDGGVTWTEKVFSGAGTGLVRDVVFATPTVGYLAHSIAGPAGRILRTINGGQTWYVLPESSGSIPANDYVGALAACADDPNVVYGAGLAANGTDGFLVKASN